MNDIYALKEMLCKQLKEYGRKGELSAAILERVDMLAHAVKNLDKIIETYEMEEGDNSYSSGRNSMASHARHRDSMGRYSSDGRGRRYDGNSYGMENMVDSIRDMMQELPPDVQRDAQRFVQKLEAQM